MKNQTDRDQMHLNQILEHCDRIFELKTRFGPTFDSFKNDQAYQDAVNMNIFQIGEIANHISDDLRIATPNIPWSQIIGIRNIIGHGYITLEPDIIWKTIETDIPDLKGKIAGLLL